MQNIKIVKVLQELFGQDTLSQTSKQKMFDYTYNNANATLTTATACA